MKRPKTKGNPALRPMMIAIQTAMCEQELDVTGLCKALGMPIDRRSAVYNWVAGKNGPNPVMRAKLAKVLGLTEEQLTAPGSKSKQLLGPAQRAVALVAAQPVAVALTAEPVRDVFSITGRSDGQISVRLQATLDAQRGMALARFLMDFGLIVGDHAENEAS